MTISFDEARLSDILDSARNCRMKQLESDFAVWQEYAVEVDVKEDLTNRLDDLLTDIGREMLREYDDVTSLMVCKAQDYFYKQGFNDCLNLLRVFLGGLNEERKAK